jgi:dTDP-4-dehydrorhamnose reductase
MKILITGGNGNIAKMIRNNLLSDAYEIVNLSRYDLDVLNQFDIEKYLSENNFDCKLYKKTKI